LGKSKRDPEPGLNDPVYPKDPDTIIDPEMKMEPDNTNGMLY